MTLNLGHQYNVALESSSKAVCRDIDSIRDIPIPKTFVSSVPPLISRLCIWIWNGMPEHGVFLHRAGALFSLVVHRPSVIVVETSVQTMVAKWRCFF